MENHGSWKLCFILSMSYQYFGEQYSYFVWRYHNDRLNSAIVLLAGQVEIYNNALGDFNQCYALCPGDLGL